jgi:hypothetical protein
MVIYHEKLLHLFYNIDPRANPYKTFYGRNLRILGVS